MSVARERLLVTRRMMIVAAFAKALAWGAATATIVLLNWAVADGVLGLPLEARRWVAISAVFWGAAAATFVWWHVRGVMSLERVALWIEERIPWLRYSLVTAADPRHGTYAGDLDRPVGEAVWGGVLFLAVWRALLPPVAIVAVGALILVLLPEGLVARVAAPRAGDALERVGMAAARDPLAVVVATVRPPAYSGERERTIEDPSGIAALVGSEIVLRGRGRPTDVEARRGSDALAVSGERDRWSVALPMPREPAALRLASFGRERIIVLEPRLDAPPAVQLLLPARDTVMRTAAGRLPLAAEAEDDYGIASAAFEYIVSSGEGESFTFRSGTLGGRRVEGDRAAELRIALSLDSLRLGPGDVVHLRAVARDRNPVSGPSTGVSETRSVRVARTGEYDSVAVEGAPPPEADQSLLSQRMLIILTERLEARRPRLGRETVVDESRGIAQDQGRLRRRVGEIIFTRLGEAGQEAEHSHGPGEDHHEELEGPLSPEELLARASEATGHDVGEVLDFAEGESPVVAINRPLLEAYNAMWEAGGHLEVGEPARALPPMRRALDALQRARAAERYYLRGRPPVVVVDIDRARLAKQADVERGTRRLPTTPTRDTLTSAERFASAVQLLDASATAAVDSLLLLRVDVLVSSPAAATAIGEAVDALRAGREATDALLRARRLLVGTAAARDGLPSWGTPWP